MQRTSHRPRYRIINPKGGHGERGKRMAEQKTKKRSRTSKKIYERDFLWSNDVIDVFVSE